MISCSPSAPFAAIRALAPQCRDHPADHAALRGPRPRQSVVRHGADGYAGRGPGTWRACCALRRALRGFDRIYDLQTSGRSGWYFSIWLGRPHWSGIAPGLLTAPCQPRPGPDAHAGTPARPVGDGGDHALSQTEADLASNARRDGHTLQRSDSWRCAASPAQTLAGLSGLASWPTILGRGMASPPRIVGTKVDASFAATIRAICPSAVDLTGRTTLLQLGPMSSPLPPWPSATIRARPTLPPPSAFPRSRSSRTTATRRSPGRGGNVTVLASADLADLTLETGCGCPAVGPFRATYPSESGSTCPPSPCPTVPYAASTGRSRALRWPPPLVRASPAPPSP